MTFDRKGLTDGTVGSGSDYRRPVVSTTHHEPVVSTVRHQPVVSTIHHQPVASSFGRHPVAAKPAPVSVPVVASVARPALAPSGLPADVW